MLVVPLYCSCCSVSNYGTQHIRHQISGLLGEDLFRVNFMLVDDFALTVHDLLDHISIIEGTAVTDGGISISQLFHGYPVTQPPITPV